MDERRAGLLTAMKFLQEERMKLLQEEVRLKAKLEGLELALKILEGTGHAGGQSSQPRPELG